MLSVKPLGFVMNELTVSKKKKIIFELWFVMVNLWMDFRTCDDVISFGTLWMELPRYC